MKHGSLFSGIGGFDLAAEWMGWENVFHCEINPFGQKVLHHYWPNAESFTDITKTDFKKYNGTIDIISGGFPCQPYSNAGKRKGKEDERHLWPEMLRAIGEIQPRWIVGENVPGLANWEGGMVLNEIKTNLEGEGFEVFSPVIIPACAKDAPHRRDRIWIIAHANGKRQPGKEYRQKESGQFTEESQKRDVTNAEGGRLEGFGGFRKTIKSSEQLQPIRTNERVSTPNLTNSSGFGFDTEFNEYGDIKDREERREYGAANSTQSAWYEWPTQPPICNGNDGLSGRLDIKTISYSRWRNESIKAGGNAIVPQVAYEIFKAIEAFEMLHSDMQHK